MSAVARMPLTAAEQTLANMGLVMGQQGEKRNAEMRRGRGRRRPVLPRSARKRRGAIGRQIRANIPCLSGRLQIGFPHARCA